MLEGWMMQVSRERKEGSREGRKRKKKIDTPNK